MKKIFIVTLLFVIYNSVAFTQTRVNNLMEREGNEEFKRQRQEWLNSLHRCEEGLPYWIIDQKTKELFQNEKNNKENSINSNEFANGRIFGEWIEKGSDNLSGRVHTLDFDTNTNIIYLASAGGNIWKGTIKGDDWICLNNSKKFANPRMVKILWPGNKQRLLVVANSPCAMYYTDDEGKSWQKANGFENAERWGWSIRGAVTINQEIYVLLNEWNFTSWKSMISIYKSSDLGKNFSRLYSAYVDYALCDIWAPSYDVNIVYFAIADTLFSIDNEGTFKVVSNNPFIDKYINGIQLKGTTVGRNIHLYYALRNTSVQTIFYYSSDGGVSFTKTGKLDFYPFEKNSFEVSQIYPTNIYFGQVEFYLSTNRGESWKRANSWTEYYSLIETKLHADIPGISSFRKWNNSKKVLEEILFVCTDGGIYVSYDNGSKYRNLSLKNLNISQYYSIYTFDKAGKILIAGSQDQGLQYNLNDSGRALGFNQVISGDYGHLTSSNGGRFLWTTYPGFAMLVFNPQSGYFDAKSWNFIGRGFLWLPPIVADPDNPAKSYLLSGNNNKPEGTPASYIYELEYDQNADSILYRVLPFNFASNEINRKISALCISPINTDVWFALTNDGKFFRSFDRGNNWQIVEGVAGPNSHYFYGNKIVASKFNIGKVIIAGSGYSNPGVLISIDTGKTFSTLSQNIPTTLFYDIELNEDESLLFAATEIGPFVYHFAERKWHFLGGINCPDNIFWDVEYLPDLKTVRYATYGRGIWDFKIAKVLSGEKEIIPSTEQLIISKKENQSNNEVIFEVKCDPGTFLTIGIYDAEGRLVKTLWNGHVTDDKILLFWNGTTDNNAKLPSGKYFCIAKGKSVVKYESIILLR